MLVRSARLVVLAFLAIFILLEPERAAAAIHTVQGRITSFPTGLPVAGAYVRAYVNSRDVGTARSAEDGRYTVVFDAEPPNGTTGQVAVSADGHIPATNGFDPTGTDVVVDVALRIYGRITGTLHHAVSGAALSGLYASGLLFDDTSWVVAKNGWVQDGSFEFDTVAPDTYRVCAGGLGTGFARQCFNGFEIQSTADMVAATPVAVADGAVVSGIHLHIAEGGRIRGTIRDERTSAPLGAQVVIELFDSLGYLLEVKQTSSDPDTGAYELDGMPAGTFYVAASIPSGRMRGRQLYPGIECPAGTCPPITTGQRILAARGGTIEGIDFTFGPIATLSGTIADRTTGQPIGDVQVRACFPVLFGWPSCHAATSGPDGQYLLDVDNRTYTLYAEAPDSHVDQVYPDIPCLEPFCSGTRAPPIVVREGDALTGYDFALQRSSRIAGTVRDALTGAALGYASVAVFDADYKFLWSVWPSSESGSYVTAKWPGGTYYVAAYRTWALSCGFHLDRRCPPSATDPAAIAAVAPTPVVVGEGELREGIDIYITSMDPLFANGFD